MNAIKNKVEITIERQDGTIEVKDISDKFMDITAGMFARIAKATKDAGRGTVTGYKVTPVAYEVELTQKDKDLIDYYRHNDAVKNSMNP